MSNVNSPNRNTEKAATKPSSKKTELNEQFYTLLKELVETQTVILQKVTEVQNAITQNKPDAKSALDRWKEMG